MAFIVEDGSGLEDATSYVDLAYAEDYAESFFDSAEYATWTGSTGAELERSLNRATMYLDNTYMFKGVPETTTQALQFPRSMVYTRDMAAIVGVPKAIKQATCLVAIRMLNGVKMSPDVSRNGVVREKIDTIDITYADGGSKYTKFTEIDNLLQLSNLVVDNRTSSNNIRVVQG